MKVIISNVVSLNGGDFAILDAMIKVLRKAYGADLDIVVYDNNAEIAKNYYPGINYRELVYLKYIVKKSGRIGSRLAKIYNNLLLKRLLSSAKLLSVGSKVLAYSLLSKREREDLIIYNSADLVISTGGTILVENYDLTPRFFDYDLTLALKKPLVFFTQSLGPFNSDENIKNVKRIFNQSQLILLRDEASFDNLKSIGVNMENAHVCADVVFAVADSEIIENAKHKSFRTPFRIIISVRDWPYFKFKGVEEGTVDYYSSIAALCEYVVQELDGEVVFISTCQGIQEYWYDDSLVAEKIFSLLPEKVKTKVIVDRSFNKPEKLKEVMQSADIAISTRMHSAIQALSVGIPVLPIAYEFKTKELFKKLIDEEFILDIESLEPKSTVMIFEKFISYLKLNRADLFQKVEKERISSLEPIRYLIGELER
ncbi:polysaccharide pyruvyl transferase family protein [Nibribacter koreensis]|uniref:Polysaccharide pyruvyl transferase family protein n=1 Tax=Nibribacter koreensis TaxID=1084519 RepID=A0ABP8FH47_9BACT